jgi:hypothetical protein
MKWTEHEPYMRVIRNMHKIVVRKRDEKRPLGRSRHRWEDYNKRVWTGFTGSE